MVEHQARDLVVQGSNPGPGSNFSLKISQGTNYKLVFSYQFDLKTSK